jgi:hypothetical protein
VLVALEVQQQHSMALPVDVHLLMALWLLVVVTALAMTPLTVDVVVGFGLPVGKASA